MSNPESTGGEVRLERKVRPGTYCGEECEETGPVCDFCKHYDFNANEKGWYMGNGWCRFHQQKRDPASGCNDFHCFKADDTPV